METTRESENTHEGQSHASPESSLFGGAGITGASASPPAFQLMAGSAGPIQRVGEYSAAPMATAKILQGATHADDILELFPEYHPQHWQGEEMPDGLKNMLWDFHKAFHWRESFGRDARSWAETGLNRLVTHGPEVDWQVGLQDPNARASVFHPLPLVPTSFSQVVAAVEQYVNQYIDRTEVLPGGPGGPQSAPAGVGDEADFLSSGRMRSLERGTEMDRPPEVRATLAAQIQERFPQGVTLCFTIPDAYRSRAEARGHIDANHGNASRQAQRVVTGERDPTPAQVQAADAGQLARRTMANENVFMNESIRFAAEHQSLALVGGDLRMGVPTVYQNAGELVAKAREIQARLRQIMPRDHPSTRIHRLAVFSHGSRNRMYGHGYSRPGYQTNDALGHARNTLVGETEMDNLLGAIDCTDDVHVRLFACNTASGGEGSLSDHTRDTLVGQGHAGAAVIGHTSAGRATGNPDQSLMVGDRVVDINIRSRAHQDELVPATFPAEMLADSLTDSSGTTLVNNAANRRKIKDSVLWLFRLESWMIDLPDLEQGDMTTEEYETRYRQEFYTAFRSHWRLRMRENRAILDSRY